MLLTVLDQVRQREGSGGERGRRRRGTWTERGALLPASEGGRERAAERRETGRQGGALTLAALERRATADARQERHRRARQREPGHAAERLADSDTWHPKPFRDKGHSTNIDS